ncbi:Na+/H+ antiporter subunit E [Corynebacterium sp. HMSC04H06]|uniref:Na+/H+ antiporter subunit E n=1 Tax=Corynebacterium sp. HMSC04H06 TaxID=1581050 RepID=UPI0008A32080|nr:Na+/H+ antiporter subunit E [Corynebacterium sp. HMSC04H06]OFS21969.1 cation:proton antiporter [Corynebacterium sp. HMSC04H06]
MTHPIKPTFSRRLRYRFRPGFLLAITVMWVLLMGEVSIANIVAGVGVGLVIMVIFPLPAMPINGLSVSWGRLIKYAFTWTGELFQASLKVGWLGVRPQPKPRSAILNVPMRVESEFVLSFAVMLYNLQPGGTITDIDIANRMLTAHVLDADTDTDIAREIDNIRKLEAHMIDIFERKVR